MTIKTFIKLIRLHELKLASKQAVLSDIRNKITISEDMLTNAVDEVNYSNDSCNYDIMHMIRSYITKKEVEINDLTIQLKKLKIQEEVLIAELTDIFSEKKKTEMYVEKLREKAKETKKTLQKRT